MVSAVSNREKLLTRSVHYENSSLNYTAIKAASLCVPLKIQEKAENSNIHSLFQSRYFEM